MDKKARKRAPMRRLKASDEEFVLALVELRTTKALAEHFNVTEHTITMRRSRLRRLGVPIPSTPAPKPKAEIDPQQVAKLTAILEQGLPSARNAA